MKYLPDINLLQVSREEKKLLDRFLVPEESRRSRNLETYLIGWIELMRVVEKLTKTRINKDDPDDLDTYWPRTFGMIDEENPDKPYMVRFNRCPVISNTNLMEALGEAILDLLKTL